MTAERDDWDQHWRAYSDSARSNPAQSYRRKLISRNLAIGSAKARVLDIGSGTGDMVAELHEQNPGGEFLGVELSVPGVEIAREKVPQAHFVQRDLLTDAEVPTEFQGWATHAVCSEVLEHVDEPAKLLWNARAFLAPGCRMVVTVPGGPRSAFDRHIGHRRHYTTSDLAGVIDQAGLELETVVGAGFPFFNLYRYVVVARGQRLVDDVASSDEGASTSRLAELTMKVFGGLFRMNLDRSRFGYQIVAVCREPAVTVTA